VAVADCYSLSEGARVENRPPRADRRRRLGRLAAVGRFEGTPTEPIESCRRWRRSGSRRPSPPPPKNVALDNYRALKGLEEEVGRAGFFQGRN